MVGVAGFERFSNRAKTTATKIVQTNQTLKYFLAYRKFVVLERNSSCLKEIIFCKLCMSAEWLDLLKTDHRRLRILKINSLSIFSYLI